MSFPSGPFRAIFGLAERDVFLEMLTADKDTGHVNEDLINDNDRLHVL